MKNSFKDLEPGDIFKYKYIGYGFYEVTSYIGVVLTTDGKELTVHDLVNSEDKIVEKDFDTYKIEFEVNDPTEVFVEFISPSQPPLMVLKGILPELFV